MIEMQYNFPLLPGLPGQWRERLRLTVESLGDEDFEAMRPTFRKDRAELVAIAAKWLRLPAERTVLTEGSHHGGLISYLAGGLAGKPVAVDAAAYTGGLEQARCLRCELVACAIDEEGMLPESLREQCMLARNAGRPVAGLFLTVSVHNPLGFVASLERRERLVEVAREFDLLILEDDTYAFMARDAPKRLAELAPERVFYINGLSKSYAPAVRTGFLVAPEGYEGAVWTAVKNVATGTSSVHNAAALSLVADGTVDRVIAAKIEEGAKRNAAARAALGEGACWPGAPCAWHLWVKLPERVTAQSFEAKMAERGVAISGGNWFAAGDGAPNGFRMALGGEVDAAVVQRGVEMVADELRDL